MLCSCAAWDKSVIDGAVKDMKFLETGNIEAADADCRKLILDMMPPSILVGGIVYAVKAQYNYQDCMAKKGFTCTADCAYNAK